MRSTVLRRLLPFGSELGDDPDAIVTYDDRLAAAAAAFWVSVDAPR